jgi:hypothetical protein
MGRAKALSVIIPGRNEEFMRHTVEDVLAHSGPDTEVIAVCDGYVPNPPLVDHPRLHAIYLNESIGQRAATNLGVRESSAKYVMKLDAHCSTDENFDEKLLPDMQRDITMIPSMHRLHVFDWHCNGCGNRIYQGTIPQKCENQDCAWDGTEGKDQFTKIMVWSPREQYHTTKVWRFDRQLHFQYWPKYHKDPTKPGNGPNPHWERYKEQEPTGLVETMSCIGCCFLMDRDRYWELGGMDEGHGSWGQMGTELACKTWLSGGRMVTSLKTWIAHLFRTGNFGKNGESSWPYPISQRDIDAARKHSRDLWLKDAWPGQKRPLSWLIDHFKPVPDWH